MGWVTSRFFVAAVSLTAGFLTFAAAPQIKISVTDLSFGISALGNTSGNQLSISNSTGTVPLEISYKFSGANAGDFSLDKYWAPTSVAAGSTGFIGLEFTPHELGTRTADLVITTNSDPPAIVHLTGTGVRPPNLVIMPTSFDFGDQATGMIGQSATFTLTNTGGAFPSVRYLLGLAGKAFTWVAGTCYNTIPPNSSCTIVVDFHPYMPGPASGSIVIYGVNIGSRLTVQLKGNGVGRVTYKAHDFDGDGRSDYALWSASDGNWQVARNVSPETPYKAKWGVLGDIPISGDFDGDGRTDYAVWRPYNGTWYIFPSHQPTSSITQQWGAAGDIPINGDFDGDGKADFAVFRPSNGTWYVLPSSEPSMPIVKQWGWAGDIPVSTDFDGDGKADFAVFRPSNGTWYIVPSSAPDKPYMRQWGFDGDIPISADFDGDGKDDIAVWRPFDGTWYIIPSSTPNSPYAKQWGSSGDIPIPDDFDGDGKADFAVRRPWNQTWYVLTSSNPDAPLVVSWGDAGDQVPQ